MSVQKEVEKMVEEMARSILEYNLKHNIILYILILIMFIFNCVALSHKECISKTAIVKECKNCKVFYLLDINK